MVSFKPSPDFFIQKPQITPVKVDETSSSSAANLHDRYVEIETCLKAKVNPPQLPVNSDLLTELDQTIKNQLDEVKSHFDEISQEITRKHPIKSQAFASQKVLNALQEIANCKHNFQAILFTLREALHRNIQIQGLNIKESASRILTILQVIEITENDRLSRSWGPIEEYYHEMCDQSKDIYEVRLDFMNELKVNLTHRGISWKSPKTQPVVLLEKFQSTTAAPADANMPQGPTTPVTLPSGNQLPAGPIGSGTVSTPVPQYPTPGGTSSHYNLGPGLLGPPPLSTVH